MTHPPHTHSYGAQLFVGSCRRCGWSLKAELREELHEACRQALASEDVGLHVLYGVVVTLCHHGTEVLVWVW